MHTQGLRWFMDQGALLASLPVPPHSPSLAPDPRRGLKQPLDTPRRPRRTESTILLLLAAHFH